MTALAIALGLVGLAIVALVWYEYAHHAASVAGLWAWIAKLL